MVKIMDYQLDSTLNTSDHLVMSILCKYKVSIVTIEATGGMIHKIVLGIPGTECMLTRM